MIEFTVMGTPAPQGSKVRNRFGGMREDNPNTKPWRAAVADMAASTFDLSDHDDLLVGPVEATAVFVFPRPKSHYRTGRNAHLLRDAAPDYCAGKPDLDKLARAVGDALTGIVVRDDAQIVRWTLAKVYGAPTRAEIRVEEMPVDRVYDVAAWDERQRLGT